MSRIVVSRHPDGTERVVCGWDRQLATFFADLYGPADEDGEGECEVTVGPMVGLSITSTLDLSTKAAAAGIPIKWTATLARMLAEHRELDYPESNVKVDLT